MTLHDPYVRPGLGSYRRKLTRIERRLTADAPSLTSMFAMFNQLNEGDQPAGGERVSPSRWPPPEWPRPPAYLAVLLALAAVMTLCLTLSSQIHTVVRPCMTAATAGPAAPAAPAAPAMAGGWPARGLSCPAYANTKQ